MSEIDRLVAYAKRTALELSKAGAPLDCLPITTRGTAVRRTGFLGMKRLEVSVSGPDELVSIGWLLWSHPWKEAEAYDSTGNARRPRGGLSHTWTVTRGWWLTPDGAIDVIDHRVERIWAIGKTHQSIEDRSPSTPEQLVHPDLPWRHWGRDDKRFTLYEHGQDPAWNTSPRMPGLRLSTALTNLRKRHQTYRPRGS